jgi:tRNA U34 5-carboxymethylaminomethyl modifying GTPase MnmE/TrmE
MNQLEAAFLYGDFSQLYQEVRENLLENVLPIVYNISFVDEKTTKDQVVKNRLEFVE